MWKQRLRTRQLGWCLVGARNLLLDSQWVDAFILVMLANSRGTVEAQARSREESGCDAMVAEGSRLELEGPEARDEAKYGCPCPYRSERRLSAAPLQHQAPESSLITSLVVLHDCSLPLSFSHLFFLPLRKCLWQAHGPSPTPGEAQRYISCSFAFSTMPYE